MEKYLLINVSRSVNGPKSLFSRMKLSGRLFRASNITCLTFSTHLASSVCLWLKFMMWKTDIIHILRISMSTVTLKNRELHVKEPRVSGLCTESLLISIQPEPNRNGKVQTQIMYNSKSTVAHLKKRMVSF